MIKNQFIRGLGALSLMAIGACHSLDVQNPNEPDAQRALSDPKAVEALASGAMQTWFNAYTNLRGAGVLSTQARTYTSSWNNGNLNYHSGVDISPSDVTTSPLTWTRNARPLLNDPAAGARTTIDAFWTGGLDESATQRPGFYSSLAASNNVLIAILKKNLVITNASTTKRAETIGRLMQGASLMMIALTYDKGYALDEDSDPLAAPVFDNRRVMRDFAVAKLEAAAALAAANTFTTPSDWTNGGASYSNTDIAKVARTMAAMTLAWYPRADAENSTVDWAKVATLASGGLSSGTTPVNWKAAADGYNSWVSELMYWFNGIDGGRVHTRVAHFMDPATQVDPYRLGVGSVQPNSPDARMGDGSFGTAETADAFGTVPKTAAGGSDFAWLEGGEVFRPDRGFYHQSNIGHVRYDASGVQDGQDVYGAFGTMPAINAELNDLLWAEALLRQNSAALVPQAITLINKSRVGRGGLSPAVGAVGSPTDGPCMANGRLAKDGGVCTIWSMLLYEYDVELMGQGPAPFWHHRHLPLVNATNWEQIAGTIFNGPRNIQGLLPGTAREMPVPYRELGVIGQPLYTFGGTNLSNSPAP